MALHDPKAPAFVHNTTIPQPYVDNYGHIYHTNHSGGMFDDWVDYPEEGVSRVRCEHNIHERTDYYRCNVILERPINPTLETLTPAYAGLNLTVDGVATALKPESIYISTVFSSDGVWKLRTEIDASMYLGQCHALAKGQDKRPAVFFVYTPNADGSTWVLDTTSLDIKTTLNHSWSEWTIDDETPKTGDLTPVKAVAAGLLFSFAAICAIILDISSKKNYSNQ